MYIRFYDTINCRTSPTFYRSIIALPTKLHESNFIPYIYVRVTSIKRSNLPFLEIDISNKKFLGISFSSNLFALFSLNNKTTLWYIFQNYDCRNAVFVRECSSFKDVLKVLFWLLLLSV